MSSTLYWQPVAPPDKTLGTELKFLLREMNDGCIIDDMTFTPANLSTLSALRVGRSGQVVKDIDTLIDAVERYDIVRVFEGNF